MARVEGIFQNVHTYEIIDKRNITKLGSLDCYLIDAKANSRIGETKLLSYFNTVFGFVNWNITILITPELF